jgi:hypothetical protein
MHQGDIQQRQHLEPKTVSFFLLNKKLIGYANMLKPKFEKNLKFYFIQDYFSPPKVCSSSNIGPPYYKMPRRTVYYSSIHEHTRCGPTQTELHE